MHVSCDSGHSHYGIILLLETSENETLMTGRAIDWEAETGRALDETAGVAKLLRWYRILWCLPLHDRHTSLLKHSATLKWCEVVETQTEIWNVVTFLRLHQLKL